jgi:seryl-tRNA synthetase
MPEFTSPMSLDTGPHECCSSGHTFGQTALHGERLHAYHKIDAAFQAFAKRLNAMEYHFPSFIGAADLRKMDYLHSFPQHATFPQVLQGSDDNIQRFRNSDLINDRDEIQLTAMAAPKAILTPAACYHFYINFQNHNFSKTQIFTTRNTCYRHETEYVALERQWSFTMREIVCIGEEYEVQQFVHDMKEWLSRLFARLEMPIDWQTAQDPFFNPGNNPKHLLQKLHPNKHEMVFDNRLALGSANYHRSYFGEIFNIHHNNNVAHSACIAFGVERWLAAFNNSFGENPSTWPLNLLEEI